MQGISCREPSMTRPISNAGCARGKTAAGGHKHEYLEFESRTWRAADRRTPGCTDVQPAVVLALTSQGATGASHSALPRRQTGSLQTQRAGSLDRCAADVTRGWCRCLISMTHHHREKRAGATSMTASGTRFALN